ncbi:hypothetical protein [Streptomyces flavidovirens]
MRIFGREPALVVNSFGAILAILVSFNVGLDSTEAGWLVASLAALFAAIAAALTRPIAPNAFTGLVAVVAATVTAFGFELSAELVASINGAVIAGLALLSRGQVSPVSPTTPARPTSV